MNDNSSIDECCYSLNELRGNLLELERRVSSDSVIVIDPVEYEVNYRFAKQRIRLRYSPDMKDSFIVEADGTLTPIRLLNKTENAYIKHEKNIYAEVKNNGLLYTIWSGIQSTSNKVTPILDSMLKQLHLMC